MAGRSQLSLTGPVGLPVSAVSGLSVTRSCLLTPPALEGPRPLAHPRCCSPPSSCCCCFLRLEVLPPGWTQSPAQPPARCRLLREAPASRPAVPPAPATPPLGPLGQGLGAALPCRRAAQRWGAGGLVVLTSQGGGHEHTHGECDPLSPHCRA